MKINGIKTAAKHFAYDGCHKIYLIEDYQDMAEVEKTNYSIIEIEDLPSVYKDSCELRFISNWQLTEQFAQQCEDAIFD